MATSTAGVEWTSTKTMVNIATASSLADGGVTSSARCAWGTTLAPTDVALRFRGLGNASASGNIVISYKWANLTASGSSTALLETQLDNNWQLAMVVEMNSTCAVAAQVNIPVDGSHLAIQVENSTAGAVSAISVVSISRFVKAG